MTTEQVSIIEDLRKTLFTISQMQGMEKLIAIAQVQHNFRGLPRETMKALINSCSLEELRILTYIGIPSENWTYAMMRLEQLRENKKHGSAY